MAKIGCKRQMAAVVKTCVDGSAVVYDTGLELTGGSGVQSIDLSWNYADASLYLDDKLAESDRTLTSGTMTVNVGGLSDEERKALLGDVIEDTDLIRTDAQAPFVGYGFISCETRAGVKQYIAHWLYKVQFVQSSDSYSTKAESMDYQTISLDGKVLGVIVDSTGTTRYEAKSAFTTEAEAATWLKTKANITTGK